MKIIFCLFCTIAILSISGCSVFKSKSSTKFYPDGAPSIHYTGKIYAGDSGGAL